MSHDLADDLRVEIAKGQVLVVVGAGVSIGATQGNPLASWRGLLEKGVERCVAVRGLDAKWANRVREEIRSGDLDDLLSAAEKVSSKLGFPTGGEYRRWLHETVGGLELKDRSVLEAIRDLGLPIATTNYDSLLETSTGFPAVTWRDGDKASRVIQGEEPGILHLHGHWGEPESIVLGVRSYGTMLGNPYAQVALRALQTLRTILFIGCGDWLHDPNFGALLGWTREAFQGAEARYYQLCREDELDYLRQGHRENWFLVSYGPNHEDLGPFLRDLGSSLRAGRKEDLRAKPRVHPSRLPNRPTRCFGREEEVRELVKTLLQPSPLPIPILGPPGVGKTTLMLEALHEPQVKERYGDWRFFIRCDGAKSRDALLGEIAMGVGIEPGPGLKERLFQYLERGPAVLALDNLETPWEADTTSVEDLLTRLSTTQGVLLMASIRGDQRPFGPKWSEAIRVGPFGLAAARETFMDFAGARFQSDPALDRLLEAVDRLPLAVVHMAHQAEGEPNLVGLWQRMLEKRTLLLRRTEGKERLTTIEVTLELSIDSPRMTPESRRLLSMLALLPDGAALEDLDALFPGYGDEAAPVLRKVGFAFDQGTRLRLLAPVREYVRQQHPPQKEDLDRVVTHFLRLARNGEHIGQIEGAELASRLVLEVGNLQEIILIGLGSVDPEPAIRAVLGLGNLTSVTSWNLESMIQEALDICVAENLPQLEAECWERLGDIALSHLNYDAARSRFWEALPLYQAVGDVIGEANCIKTLGDIAFRRSENDTARALFEQALALHKKVGSLLGEANCLQSLGEIEIYHADYDAARALFEKALHLFQRVKHRPGEAYSFLQLGDISLSLRSNDSAEIHFKEALALYRSLSVSTGEVSSLKGLAEVAHRRNNDSLEAEYTHQAETLDRLRREVIDDLSSFHIPSYTPSLSGIIWALRHGEEPQRLNALRSLEKSLPVSLDILSVLSEIERADPAELIKTTAREAGVSIRRYRTAQWIRWLNGDLPDLDLGSLPQPAKGFPAIIAKGFRLQNIRAFVDTQYVSLRRSSYSSSISLIVGDNAAGKTTLLKCIALAALGPGLVRAVENRPESYLRRGAREGSIEVAFELRLDGNTDPRSLGEFWVCLEIRAGENEFRAMEPTSTLAKTNAASRVGLLRRQIEDRFGLVCAYGGI